MEQWVVIPTLYCIKQPHKGIGPSGELTLIPYKRVDGFLLKGINSRTRRVIHEYGPFPSIEALESFAREEGITLETPGVSV